MITQLHNEYKQAILNGTYDIKTMPMFTDAKGENFIVIPQGCTDSFIKLCEKQIGSNAEILNQPLQEGNHTPKYKPLGAKIDKATFDKDYKHIFGTNNKKQTYETLKTAIFNSDVKFPTRVDFTDARSNAAVTKIVADAKQWFPAKYDTIPADVTKYDCILNADETKLFILDTGNRVTYTVELKDTKKPTFNDKVDNMIDHFKNNWKKTVKIGGAIFLISGLLCLDTFFIGAIVGVINLRSKIRLLEGNPATNELLAAEVKKYSDTAEGHFGFYKGSGMSDKDALSATKETIYLDFQKGNKPSSKILALIAIIGRKLTGAKYANIVIKGLEKGIAKTPITPGTTPTRSSNVSNAGNLTDTNLLQEVHKITDLMNRMKIM